MQSVATAQVFISYRRDDSRLITERMHERLSQVFGTHAVFLDIDDIPPGQDFPEHIQQILMACKVVLVVIGKQWLDATDERGRPRLENPNDFVRAELEWAAEHGKEVLPVLVEGARMPALDELPESIRFLVRHNALEVRSGADFSFTMQRLCAHLCAAYSLKRADTPVRWEIPVLVFGIVASLIGGVASVSGVIMMSIGSMTWGAREAFENTLGWEFLGPLFLGSGPLAIAVSRWMCCQRAEGGRSPFGNAIFVAKRKSPKSMFGFALGLSSIGWGILSAPFAIVLSVLGWRQIAAAPAVFRGKQYAAMGVLFAIVGVAVSSYFQVWIWSQYQTYVTMDAAQQEIDSGQWEAAEPLVETALRDLPQHTRPYFLAGELYVAQHRYDEAIQVLEIAIGDLEKVLPNLRKNDVMLKSYELLERAYREIGESERSQVVAAKIKELEELPNRRNRQR